LNFYKNIQTFLLFLVLAIVSGFSSYAQDIPLACGGDLVRYGVKGNNGTSVFEWQIDEEVGEIVTVYGLGDSVDIRWNQVGALGGMQTITVTETNLFGCEGEPYSQTLLVSSPTLDIGGDAAICFGESYEFFANASETNDYLWQDGVTTSETFIANTEGEYWVRIVDSVGCSIADTAYLTVNDLPAVDLGNDTVLCDDDDLLVLDVSQYGDFYNWWEYNYGTDETSNLGISSFIEVGTETATRDIWVSVEDANGCIGYDTITVAFCGDFVVPNAFTPNDDGHNETWDIQYLNQFKNVTVDVYNRFGDRVFSSKGYDVAWDGRDGKGKKLPMDTYYYVIDLHNGEQPKVGTVTLVR